ncbi:MAG: hypothetical protein F6K11_01555 [Leptolyngbya sp. SIO3F4]|nr:hypothetical protein [Leptolyngbya sp. SIO3F4]
MELYSSDVNRGQSDDIEEIRIAVQVAAQKRAGDCEALLALLRQLESLHQDIRETLFQESLPTNRQHLYNLLRDIEVNGGWPYIQRMKLTELLQVLEFSLESETSEG